MEKLEKIEKMYHDLVVDDTPGKPIEYKRIIKGLCAEIIELQERIERIEGSLLK